MRQNSFNGVSLEGGIDSLDNISNLIVDVARLHKSQGGLDSVVGTEDDIGLSSRGSS